MLNPANPFELYQIDPLQQTFILDQTERQYARRQQYIKVREYDSGVHPTQITDRQRKYLSLAPGVDFSANYCPMIINAKSDRLKIIGFDTENTQKDWLTSVWRRNRMDGKQGIVHRAAVRDGDAFVLVEWDDVAKIPRFHYEPADGGEGVMVYYSEERRDEIAYASKLWQIKHGSDTGKVQRINLYFPDRIEKYLAQNGQAWKAYETDIDIIMPGKLGNAGVSWWTDNRAESGKPLGIPIVHFKHNDTGGSYGTSHIADVMPIQDAVNKTLIDLLSACDTEGFRLLVGLGNVDWSGLKVGPGAIATVPASPDKADLKAIDAGDISGLLTAYSMLIMEMARISGTPLSYFQTSGQVAAEGTMKQQEVALVSQVEKTQTDFGNSWEDCMIIARRLHNVFGDKKNQLSEDKIIDAIWKQAESRNDKEQAETLSIKVRELGVSQEQAQSEMGYDAPQRASFAREKMRKQALAIRRNLPTNNTEQDAASNLTQTENESEATDATTETAAA